MAETSAGAVLERLRGGGLAAVTGGGGVRLQVEPCHDEAPRSFTSTGDRRQILPKPPVLIYSHQRVLRDSQLL